jgi:hypothetical protein
MKHKAVPLLMYHPMKMYTGEGSEGITALIINLWAG